MWYCAVLVLFCTTSPVLISSALQCYSCSELIIVNYLVTNSTVPSFSECQLVDATQCSLTVTWDENINVTAIAVNSQNASSVQSISGDAVTSMIVMEAGPYGGTPFFARELVLSCTSKDKCNDEMTLKRILRSLSIKDQLRQELLPLIQVIYPFNPNISACSNFTNSTSYCPPVDLTDCQRCEISVDRFSSSNPEVCATCRRSSVDVNAVIHSATFLLNGQTQLIDHVQLGCQTKGCNSIANINEIYRASNITFDFHEFFEQAYE